MNNNIKDNILLRIENLIAEYEVGLGFLQNRKMTSFDVSTLPPTLGKMLTLAATQSPEFSNVAIVTTATFNLAHMYGQVRPAINDPAYSQDSISPNFYAIIIAPSGASKDLTYRALLKTTKKGLKHIADLKEAEENERALAAFIRRALKDNPTFDVNTITEEDYIDPNKPKLELVSDMESTRGGVAKQLSSLARSSYGMSAIFESELGMAIQSSTSAAEVITLLSKLFDMGSSTSAQFKSAEAQEQSIADMFPNFLGISSPTPFYQSDGAVRKTLVPAMETALARRTTIIFSSLDEDYENMYIPGSLEEERETLANSGRIVAELTAELQDILLTTVESLVDDKSIMMDEEAATVYLDYKGYNKKLAQRMVLKNGESVEALEIAGRAWKCLRIAALWTLAENSRIIPKHILIAAIYFADYTAQHLTRFSNAMKLEDYQLFIKDWEQGLFQNDTLPIDQAITRGYITSVTAAAIQAFLKPVNSRLSGSATVAYNDVLNSFIFTPIIKNTSNLYSYRATRGHTTDTITKASIDKPVTVFEKLLTADSSFTPFDQDITKLIVLQVDKSQLSMQMINKYLCDTTHFIATRTDIDDSHSFTLILPVSTEVTRDEYKYISMSIATQLMLHVLPEVCEASTIFHGYDSATCLVANENSKLYDISGLKGQHASGAPVSILEFKAAIKPTKAVVDKYFKSEIMDNQALIIDMLNASSTKLLLFASIVNDLVIHYVPTDSIESFIDSTNASLEVSIINEDKITYLLEPFKDL
jgi:hypothetical protein